MLLGGLRALSRAELVLLEARSKPFMTCLITLNQMGAILAWYASATWKEDFLS